MKKFEQKSAYSGLGDWFYSILMYLMLLLGATVFFLIAVMTKSPDICFDNEPVYPIDTPWDITFEGGSFSASLPVKFDAKPDTPISYATTLHEQTGTSNSVIFYTQHQYVKVYLGDELIYTFGENLQMPFHMPPTSGWQFVRLPSDWPDKTLRIELTGVYPEYSGRLDAVYLGTKNAFSFMVLKLAAPNLLICLPVIVGGFLLLFASLFLAERPDARKMRSLGLFAIVTSSWILCESRISQMLFRKPLGGSLDFILFGLIPIVLLRFFMTYRSFKNSRFIRGLYICSLINYVVIHILQITGTRNYIETLTGSHILIILGVVYLLHSYAYQKVKKIPVADPSIYYASFTMAVFGLVDIVRLYLPINITDSVMFTKLGLVFFIGILGYFAIRGASLSRIEAIEKQTLQKLAYCDMLTGLKNRTAFETNMEKYRSESNSLRPVILMTDVNNLKQINDTMGHTCGDRAIIYAAECLERSFGSLAGTFRIGGDEFCVIFEAVTDDTLADSIQKFRQLISKSEEEIGFAFEVAVGWKRMDNETVDQCMIAADRLMYQSKAAMKSGEDAALREDNAVR